VRGPSERGRPGAGPGRAEAGGVRWAGRGRPGGFRAGAQPRACPDSEPCVPEVPPAARGGVPLGRGRPWQAARPPSAPCPVLGGCPALAAPTSGTAVSPGEFVLTPQGLGLTAREGKEWVKKREQLSFFLHKQTWARWRHQAPFFTTTQSACPAAG